MDGELGAFLRSRREAVRPADVGLPEGPRRRAPGLRRSELATLAGISVDYLIRIEQGRDTHPSVQVLAALAAALRLSAADIDYLQQLAVVSGGTELMCPHGKPAPARTVRPALRAVLDRLDPAPTFIINHLTDLLAWNDGYDRLARPLGMLDGDQPNLLWFTLADERAHDAYPDWDDVADEQVAYLHELRRGDTDADNLATVLSRTVGAAFTHRWERRPTEGKRTGVQAISHPEVGMLRLAFETLEPADRDYRRLVIHLPADAATAAGLDRLTGRRPSALRSVSS